MPSIAGATKLVDVCCSVMSPIDVQTGSHSTVIRWIVILGAILQVAIPALPGLGIGERIGSQSDEVRTLITPAGWAFSIWGPLFTGSAAFAIYQLLPGKADDPLLARLRWPAAGAFLGNAVWALYTQSFGLSAISAAIITFTLLCLLTVYRVFAGWEPGFTRTQRWLVVLPLSALAAWLTAATIVNIAASLRFHGIDAGETAPLVSAAVVIIGGIIAALAVARGRGNPPYALVFLWALSAIYAAGGQAENAVAVAALVSALLVVVGVVVGLRSARPGTWLGSSSV